MQSESRLRRLANQQGLKLTSFPEGSRLYHQYGPYALIDARTNAVTASGMELEDVEAQLS